MSSATRIQRLLKKAKRKEDIGIHSSPLTVGATTDKTEEMKNEKLSFSGSRARRIALMRKSESWSDLKRISIANAYAALITKLSSEISGKEIPSIVETRIADKWASTFIKLDKMLHELKIPTVLYLRTHLTITGGRIVIPALATHNAINRFVDYLERDLSQKYLMPQDMEKEILDRCSVDHTDYLRQLLTEFHLGRQYLEDVQKYAQIIDPELTLLLELRNLPGGYLVSIDLEQFRESGIMTDEICDKVDKAKEMLAATGVRQAFMREVGIYV